MIDIAFGKVLPNVAGLRLTVCLAKHDSSIWTLNGSAAAVQSTGKSLHTRGAAPHAATEGDMYL